MVVECFKPSKEMHTRDPAKLAPQWAEEASGFQASRAKLVQWLQEII